MDEPYLSLRKCATKKKATGLQGLQGLQGSTGGSFSGKQKLLCSLQCFSHQTRRNHLDEKLHKPF